LCLGGTCVLMENNVTYNVGSVDFATQWRNCMNTLQEKLPDEEYVRWFKSLEPIGYDSSSNSLKLRVASQEHINHIEQNYISMFVPIVRMFFGDQARIRYAIPQQETPLYSKQANAITDVSQIKNPFVIPGIKREVFNSQLNKDYRFDNFVEGDCNLLVRSAGIAISLAPGKLGKNNFNPLFIYGGSGLGKTHVCTAIGNEILQRYPDLKVLYVSANKFQAQFQYAAHHQELSDFIRFYQQIDTLIVDDIHGFAGDKPGTQEIFFNIFNHLHMLGKQLILTCDRPPVELEGIEARLTTRFRWGLTAELLPPDFKTKCAILKMKAHALSLPINKDIIEYIATNVKSNVRELEGTLTCIDAHVKLTGRKLTMDLVHSIMKDIVQVKSVDITIDRIIDAVCEYFKITRDILFSNTKTRDIVVARQIAMYVSKEMTNSPLNTIGKAIGNKNHATVLYAHKTIESLRDTDKILDHQVKEIERKLRY